jgi:hypothetical protein
MHHTHTVINFRGADAFSITVFSSFFGLDMDYIIRYHWCFPSWFSTSLFILSHSIYSPCWGSMCFVHPLSLVGRWSTWHTSLTCIFALPFLVLVISTTGWWERPPRDICSFVLIHGKGLQDITKKNTQLKHNHWLPKDLRTWHHILFHLHQHDCVMHMHLLM